MKNLIRISVLLSFLAVILAFKASSGADDVVGVWKTGEGNAMVKIYKNGDRYEGKIVWLKEPVDPVTGKQKLDLKNPDPRLRNRTILGMVNVFGFEYEDENEWANGRIYDPKSGNVYKGIMRLKEAGTLEVRGYIGVSLFGRTDVWKRQAQK